MSDDSRKLTQSARGDINSFLNKVAQTPRIKSAGERGRLIFAMDATASREAAWDHACRLQADMFTETAALGGLDIQLCYYRGYSEFEASPWISNSQDFLRRMTNVSCLGGYTQIEKVLRHAVAETRRKKIDALVFAGDCLEENIDELCRIAGELALLGVPLFIFHEGHDPVAAMGFKQLAELTHGAYCPFDSNSAQQLKELLGAVAVYAAGGRKALENYNKRQGKEVLQLLQRKP
ncbi:MAG: VWA domain-containing protein [Gammaproteobacteria bacterium]|nr:VWA domain-containing protein [Gammaproteobacteria bacterium]